MGAGRTKLKCYSASLWLPMALPLSAAVAGVPSLAAFALQCAALSRALCRAERGSWPRAFVCNNKVSSVAQLLAQPRLQHKLQPLPKAERWRSVPGQPPGPYSLRLPASGTRLVPGKGWGVMETLFFPSR
jgi:hypothetical protein